MKAVHFVKYVASGNDFLVIDNRKGILKDPVGAAKMLCDRKFSVGADGILLLERSKKADIRMRLFNPDGSQAEMCGNGVRCLAHYATTHKIVPTKHRVETYAGLIGIAISGDTVKAKLTDPRDYRSGLRLKVNGHQEVVHRIDTGVPHAVIVETKLETCDVESRGRALREHAHFKPRGTNVDFIRRTKEGIDVRTYERGVEGETLACGTGSTASALVASELFGIGSPVNVRTAARELLKIYFKKDKDRFYDVYLEGVVKKSFEGSVSL